LGEQGGSSTGDAILREAARNRAFFAKELALKRAVTSRPKMRWPCTLLKFVYGS
jgi:hypothetical protein